MALSNYEYGTSPRKIRPEYNPKRRNSKRELEKIAEEKEKRELEEKKKKKMKIKLEKRRHHKNIALIISGFLLLLAISYRNSLITEKFNEIRDIKKELAAVQKTNEQTEVSIESSLNLKSLEEIAKEKLGMQKLENSQKKYITLPKVDYTETASQEIVEETENENWLQRIINKIFNMNN